MTSHGSFKKAAALMLVAVLASRILGLVRDMLIARQFGQGGAVSAYTAAFNLPDLLYFFLSSGALSSAFIPVFTERFRNGKEKEAWQIFSIIACVMGVVLVIAVIIFEIYARPLVSLLAVPGFVDKYPKLVNMTIFLTRIILPCQLLFFMGGLMMGTLESRQKFSARAAGPVIYNIGIIGGAIILSHWWHIAGLAWGAMIGAFAGNVAYTFYCLKKEGFAFYPSLNIRHPGVVRVGQLALPVILGLSLPQIDIIINRYFASYVSDAAPAALNFANRLMQVPLGIFAQAAGTAILPMLAAYAARHAYDEMRSGISYGLRAILVENIPSTLFMVVMADPIVRTVYMHGEFRPSDVPITAVALQFYSAGIFAWAGQAIVARGFFALQDTITPVVIGTVSTIIFVPMNYILMKTMGTGGIALSTTVAAVLHFTLLTIFLRKRLNGLEGRKTLKTAGRILIASTAMAAICIGVRIEMSRVVGSWQLQDGDLLRPAALAAKLESGENPTAKYLYSQLTPETHQMIDDYKHASRNEDEVRKALISDLNKILTGPSLYDPKIFPKKMSEEAMSLIKIEPQGKELVHLNRLLLAASYPSQVGEGGAGGKWLLRPKDIDDERKLALLLADVQKPMSQILMSRLSARTRALLAPQTMPYSLMHDLNEVIKNKPIYNAKRLAGTSLPAKTTALAATGPTGKQLTEANRLLLEALFPREIAKRPLGRVESKMGSFLTVLMALMLGGAIYLSFLRLFKVDELDYLWNGIKRKIFKRGNGSGSNTPTPESAEQPDIVQPME